MIRLVLPESNAAPNYVSEQDVHANEGRNPCGVTNVVVLIFST